MQRLEVSGAVRPIYGSLGVKRLTEDECMKSEDITKSNTLLNSRNSKKEKFLQRSHVLIIKF